MATNAKPTRAGAGVTERPSPLRRKQMRKSASAYVEVRPSSGGNFKAKLQDLSEHGCSLSTGDNPVRLGQILTVKMLDQEAVTCIVRWTRAGRAGVEFFRPIDVALVDRLR